VRCTTESAQASILYNHESAPAASKHGDVKSFKNKMKSAIPEKKEAAHFRERPKSRVETPKEGCETPQGDAALQQYAPGPRKRQEG
jgi:hypothetical protein